MTLHWWMHWFWVTAQFFVILGNPVPSTTSDPLNRVQDHPTSTESTIINSDIPSIDTEGLYRTENPSKQSFRIAKAIGLYPQTNTAVMLERQVPTTSSQNPGERNSAATNGSDLVEVNYRASNNSSAQYLNSSRNLPILTQERNGSELERLRNPVIKKDSKITWIETNGKSNRSKYDQEDRRKELELARNVSSVSEDEDLTVLPLPEEGPKFRLVVNRTRSSSSVFASSSASGSGNNVGIRTFNRSDDDVEIDEELIEPQPFATAASILEVGVSRTRSTFPKDFQRDQIQEENPQLVYGGDAGEPNSARSAVDIAAITGSCLATVALLTTMGSLGFIMYRRRYLNPPQTLNSDKCSNPDSSGYIDDSTIRDNSEEMYSLDNDSFLNSLEAMTIQNYWTDSVKHTKL